MSCNAGNGSTVPADLNGIDSCTVQKSAYLKALFFVNPSISEITAVDLGRDIQAASSFTNICQDLQQDAASVFCRSSPCIT